MTDVGDSSVGGAASDDGERADSEPVYHRSGRPLSSYEMRSDYGALDGCLFVSLIVFVLLAVLIIAWMGWVGSCGGGAGGCL